MNNEQLKGLRPVNKISIYEVKEEPLFEQFFFDKLPEGLRNVVGDKTFEKLQKSKGNYTLVFSEDGEDYVIKVERQ